MKFLNTVKEKVSALFQTVKTGTVNLFQTVKARFTGGKVPSEGGALAVPAKKKRPASLDKKKAREGWFFVLPFVAGFILIYLPIILDSICYSFFQLDLVTGSVQWKGLAFYNAALLEDSQFVQKLVAGIQQLVIDTPMILIFSLFVAIILNQRMVGRAAFRAIFFVPVILSTGLMEAINAADILSTQMGNADGGISTGATGGASEIVSAMDIEKLFQGIKIGSGLVEYVAGAVNNIFNIVNRSGVQMLIFLGGLQGISPSIYEASSIEGATAWETFWKITFPMISPMILVNAVYTIIDSFTSDSNIVMSYIAQTYETGKELSTAMSWIYFLVIIAIIGLIFLLLRSFIFYQKRD